jgi:hypothetical protein
MEKIFANIWPPLSPPREEEMEKIFANIWPPLSPPKGEEMEKIFANICFNILIPTFVFHGIMVEFILSEAEGSQSLHRQINGQHF